MALSKNKDVIKIKEEEGSLVSIEERRIKVFERPKFTDQYQLRRFLEELENYLKVIFSHLSSEPKRLLEEGKYRYGVISAFILLESELRERFRSDESLRTTLAREVNDIDEDLHNLLISWVQIRNRAVHTSEPIKCRRSGKGVNGILSAIETFRKNYSARPRILTETDRTILGTRFLKSLCELTQGTTELLSASVKFMKQQKCALSTSK